MYSCVWLQLTGFSLLRPTLGHWQYTPHLAPWLPTMRPLIGSRAASGPAVNPEINLIFAERILKLIKNLENFESRIKKTLKTCKKLNLFSLFKKEKNSEESFTLSLKILKREFFSFIKDSVGDSRGPSSPPQKKF